MKKTLLILSFAFIGVAVMHSAKAQTYDPYAVQIINNLIANNGLEATPNVPEIWSFATWNDETPKQITSLSMSSMGLIGAASFAGLKTLKSLWIMDGSLTELDLRNCTELIQLYCINNDLTKLDLKSCPHLTHLYCSNNCLTELDMTGVDELIETRIGAQNVSLTLYKNEASEYTCAISLNNPTFGNNAISYVDGVLKSTDNTVTSTYFEIKTIGNSLCNLSGVMRFNYSNIEINLVDTVRLNVYPNPTTGKLEVTNYALNQVQGRIDGIEIFDVNGKKMKSENRKTEIEKSKILIDIAHLPAGIYFVKVITDNGEVTKKIVKQ